MGKQTLWIDYIIMDERRLLGLCRQENYRGSGKGGQARNKTSNAVRLTLDDYQATATQLRSKEGNLLQCLRKLRLMIAIDLKWSGQGEDSIPQRKILPENKIFSELKRIGLAVNPSNKNYALLAGLLSDALIASDASLKSISAATGLSVTALSKKIHEIPELYRNFQRLYRKGAATTVEE